MKTLTFSTLQTHTLKLL
uniref:Uncharacterized protein n=1 Tax=Anguilla anguilla TaxID=7936 RepID=A0A0E9TFR2_ANGAN